MSDTAENRRKEDLLPSVVEAIPRIDEVLSIVDHPGMTLDWMAVKDHIRVLTDRLAEQYRRACEAEDHHLTMLDWRAKHDEIAGRVEATIARWEAAGRSGQVGGYLHCADQLRRSVAEEDPQWSPAEIDKIIVWPEGDLVERALRGAKGRRYPKDMPLWAVVMDTFVCGSQAAINICRHYGLDPDSAVPAYENHAGDDDVG